MPTYICTVQSGVLDAAQKAGIARVISGAHAEVTGAPLYFAQVVFNDIAAGNVFIGGQPLAHDHIFVFGHIRAGRSAVDRKALIERLTNDVAKVLGGAPFSVWVYLQELPPAAMVEFGHVLPDAGDEARWVSSLPPDDAARMQVYGTT